MSKFVPRYARWGWERGPWWVLVQHVPGIGLGVRLSWGAGVFVHLTLPLVEATFGWERIDVDGYEF